jgi:hypothetical protein
VRPVIHGSGTTTTRYSGSRMRPETLDVAFQSLHVHDVRAIHS